MAANKGGYDYLIKLMLIGDSGAGVFLLFSRFGELDTATSQELERALSSLDFQMILSI